MTRLLRVLAAWSFRRTWPEDAAWSDLNAFLRKAGYR